MDIYLHYSCRMHLSFILLILYPHHPGPAVPGVADPVVELQEQLKQLRRELQFLASKGGRVILELTAKLETRDKIITELRNKIQKLESEDPKQM